MTTETIDILYGGTAFILTLLLTMVAWFAQQLFRNTEQRIFALEKTANAIATELSAISEKLGNLLDGLKTVELDKREILKEMAGIRDELKDQAVEVARLKARAENQRPGK